MMKMEKNNLESAKERFIREFPHPNQSLSPRDYGPFPGLESGLMRFYRSGLELESDRWMQETRLSELGDRAAAHIFQLQRARSTFLIECFTRQLNFLALKNSYEEEMAAPTPGEDPEAKMHLQIERIRGSVSTMLALALQTAPLEAYALELRKETERVLEKVNNTYGERYLPDYSKLREDRDELLRLGFAKGYWVFKALETTSPELGSVRVGKAGTSLVNAGMELLGEERFLELQDDVTNFILKKGQPFYVTSKDGKVVVMDPLNEREFVELAHTRSN